MMEAELGALCDRADINEDEANDALRSVRVLCAAPPHGINLPREGVGRVLWAAACLFASDPELRGTPGGFYKFVENVAALMKQSRTERISNLSPNSAHI